MMRRDGAVVGAHLAQDAARGGDGEAGVHDALLSPDRAVSASMRARKAASASTAPVLLEQLGGRDVGEDAALAQQHEPVAAGRLVHDVARHDERVPAVGEVAEEVPEVAAQHRVEADGGLVEHEQVGPSDEGGGEGDPGLLAAREVLDELVGVGDEVDLGRACGRRPRAARRRAGRWPRPK